MRLLATIALVVAALIGCNAPTSLVLNWQASLGAVNYIVFRNGTQIGGSTTISYKDSAVQQKSTYTYCVEAVAANGAQSACSQPVTVNTP